jgi:hypothetical protein
MISFLIKREVLLLNFIGATVKTISFLLFSGFIAGYTSEQLYRYIQKEALLKVSQELPPLSAITNALTCKAFNKNMRLVPYKGGRCKNRGKR